MRDVNTAESTRNVAVEETSGQNNEKKPFWTPLKTSVAGFILFSAITIGYSYYAKNEIYWPGLLMMLLLYCVFYYIGAKAITKRKGKTDDMLVAGRAMPLWISMFTMTATWVGGGYITGTAESVYKSGFVWTQAPWCYSVSLIIGGIFYAPKMRRMEFMTMLDPLEARFGKKMAGLLYIPALLGELFWSAAILTALGTTFGVILGLSFSVSIIFSALVAVAYTVVGGLWAVAHTDVLQLSIMFFGLILVLPFAFSHVGGFETAFATYQAGMQGSIGLFPPLMGWTDPAWGDYYWNWWDYALLLIFGGIPWQSYFQRVLSAKNENVAMWLSVTAGLLCAVAAIPPTLIGIAGYSADWTSLGTTAPENSSMILTYVFKYMTPELVGALALGGLAAAVMAAVAASMLSASGMAAWNVYRPLVKPQATPRQLQEIIKRCIIIIGVGATLIALNAKSVYALWYLCSDLVYVILFPQLTCALFFKKANWYGSLAGFIVAFALRIGGGEPLLGLPPIIPYPMIQDNTVLFPFRTFAAAAGFVTIFVVSYLTQKICPPQALRNLHKEQAESVHTTVA
ncbi:sodium:solute symporter family protein [Brevibacillus sp. WF146]|uniref:sodium:solute symporter family protein n=1 Tax=Brevibacillus sp. WF146 TaxID=319501 RepID=UPI0007ED7F25|nr:sodium:solute symporter family protein [Brevibacillus sp. WF146]UYZ15617.1 sodium:solute symporter family protein [Brevibacillus sp. WF146]